MRGQVRRIQSGWQLHIVGAESGDYAWIQAWKVEVMMWVFEPGNLICAVVGKQITNHQSYIDTQDIGSSPHLEIVY